MVNLKNCKLTLGLEFGSIRNQTMSVEVLNDNSRFFYNPGIDTKIVCNLDIVLPTIVTLNIIGKNMSTDTIVDPSGKIIKDKYVKIISMQLEGISVPKEFLEKHIQILTDNQTTYYSNYIGFNGRAILEFTEQNIFYQYNKLIRLI